MRKLHVTINGKRHKLTKRQHRKFREYRKIGFQIPDAVKIATKH